MQCPKLGPGVRDLMRALKKVTLPYSTGDIIIWTEGKRVPILDPFCSHLKTRNWLQVMCDQRWRGLGPNPTINLEFVTGGDAIC